MNNSGLTGASSNLTAPHRPRTARWWHVQSLVTLPVADAVLALLFMASAIASFRPEILRVIPGDQKELETWLGQVLILEAVFLVFSGTLVDLATRIKRRPPVIVIIALAAAIPLFSEPLRAIVFEAWSKGLIAFIPVAVSLSDRVAVLWYMPSAPPEDRLAARALMANRILSGLTILVIFAGFIVASMVVSDLLIEGWQLGVLVALYFLIAAVDEMRVRRPSFAANPTVLFRYDLLDVKRLEM